MEMRRLQRDEIPMIWTTDRAEVIHRIYLARGCRLADPPNPELLALEPDDIHLVCPV